jgi:hypothetical protein
MKRNYLRNAIIIIACIITFAISAMLQYNHPELSQVQLLLKYWYIYALVVCGTLVVSIAIDCFPTERK